MSSKVLGNIRGLGHAEMKAIEKLSERRLSTDEIVSLQLARELYEISEKISRKVALLISREGRVEYLVVGTKEIFYLPDLGRYRLGTGRLRQLRLVYPDLSKKHPEPVISQDVYTDLEKLRLDAVIAVKQVGNRLAATYAYILPTGQSADNGTRTEVVKDLGALELDFEKFIEDIETELEFSRESTKRTAHDRAVLVGIYPKNHKDIEGSMNELKELVRTAGVEIADVIIQKRDPDPKTIIGKGKLEEVVLRCLRLEADIIIFDSEIRPAQWRVITNNTELKILDRSMVILDIFAQRAVSNEGKLQVELAQLKYNLPRLVELDSGLSRLSGGIGGRGPGETKLEVGRRLIRDKVADLERRIDKLGEQRGLRKKRRAESEVPLVAILGYTNVGKSTLFNAMTQGNVLVENKLFATLDPAQRRRALPGFVDQQGRIAQIVMSDTVGFIRELPEELRTAFRATLEELRDAALLLHVLDASDPSIVERKAAVDQILSEMGLTELPLFVVLNKCDRVAPEKVTQLVNEFGGMAISAEKKQGLDVLSEKIGAMFFERQGDSAAEDCSK